MSLSPNENNEEVESGSDLRFDKTAFKFFFKQHYPPLCIYSQLKYGFDMHSAEDIVNTAFIKLWEIRENVAIDNSLKSYVYKMVDNISLNMLRHEKVRQRHAKFLTQTTSEFIDETTFDSIDIKQLSSAINIAIAGLPDQMRKILELRKMEDLTYSQIASRLNISVKTVDTQLSRAMTKLKERLSEFISFLIVIMSYYIFFK